MLMSSEHTCEAHVEAVHSSARAEVSSKFRLTRHAIESGKLLEFGPEHVVWRDGGIERTPMLAGCIVKLIPPASAHPSEVEAFDLWLRQNGARAVRVMPSPPEDKPNMAAASEVDEAKQQRTLREVALERARRVTTSVDAPALVALVMVAMDHGEQ